MKLLSIILVNLVAAEALFIMVLEMFFTQTKLAVTPLLYPRNT